MQTPTIEDYSRRRDVSLAAAEAAILANDKQRHLVAADAWQKMIDRLEGLRSERETAKPLRTNRPQLIEGGQLEGSA